MKHPWFNLLILLVLLVGCAPQPWKQDPDVQAAKQDCAGLPQGEHYACIERHAVTSLDPEVCRLASTWVDDMCLQAVYQAADDPAICEGLQLLPARAAGFCLLVSSFHLFGSPRVGRKLAIGKLVLRCIISQIERVVQVADRIQKIASAGMPGLSRPSALGRHTSTA